MTNTDRNLFANPFTQNRSSISINRPTNPRDLTVPESKPYDPSIGKLTVPNSDIPYFNGPIPAISNGFLGDSPLFMLADGSVVDMKKCKIVYDPNIKFKAQGYWNNPNAEVAKPNQSNEWGRPETIESMLAKIGTEDEKYLDPNLDPKSIRYWKKANEESKKLEQNLTDEQKQLLDDLHSGKMFPLSKLEDEF